MNLLHLESIFNGVDMSTEDVYMNECTSAPITTLVCYCSDDDSSVGGGGGVLLKVSSW